MIGEGLGWILGEGKRRVNGAQRLDENLPHDGVLITTDTWVSE